VRFGAVRRFYVVVERNKGTYNGECRICVEKQLMEEADLVFRLQNGEVAIFRE